MKISSSLSVKHTKQIKATTSRDIWFENAIYKMGVLRNHGEILARMI